MFEWRDDVSYSFLQNIFMRLIRLGPIPKHVGIIMDGNRRFAAVNHLKKSDGHLQGLHKLSDVLRWCRDLGIEELTVYAFSVDNFNRSQDEVSFLFKLATEKLLELLGKLDELSSHGVCIRILGSLSMLPTRIQRLASELMLKTRHNTNWVLNLCLAYSSRNELTDSLEHIRQGVRSKSIHPSDINPDLITNCLYTRLSRPLDLFIRTSGETRLSDFLIWQSIYSGATHRIVQSYWPEFSFWNFLMAIVHYQISVTHVMQILGKSTLASSSPIVIPESQVTRVEGFLKHLNQEYWDEVVKRMSSSGDAEGRLVQRPVGDASRA